MKKSTRRDSWPKIIIEPSGKARVCSLHKEKKPKDWSEAYFATAWESQHVVNFESQLANG